MKRFLRPRQTAEKVGFSISTLFRKTKSGDFPQPIKLAEKILVFDEGEVEAWMAEKQQERDAV
ncbi:MAG: hypothetical protein CL388_10445 [Acidiferrobacteraceae bacterium]|jgi:predicted DNA-binding transcriptional regulator AlpA|nr:hypothetical protein [Acidiferrobacteraceae bacterium]MDP6434398.1 AlpA family phage regulatory protein [Arenicellales bacterium]MDP6671697.1 AlpA family phage regulatory protein [Arenicellales bacterium]MDP7155611.1 AlpA family phage regulatory protein [Arenicellales bacterium]MDP7283754.1 AlpA family phage regulatory protein [Arenicellales bacterium]|tara:strand:- start:1930 stop:2118 length:189 start_codon:yes stop_codon:yes gene_type:complete